MFKVLALLALCFGRMFSGDLFPIVPHCWRLINLTCGEGWSDIISSECSSWNPTTPAVWPPLVPSALYPSLLSSKMKKAVVSTSEFRFK